MNTPAPSYPFGVNLANQSADQAAPKIPFEFASENKIFTDSLAKHAEEERLCELRRNFRRHRVNVAEERKAGRLLEDETIIPDRTINSNVKRATAPYTKYITQATAELDFRDIARPTLPLGALNDWYTSLVRTDQWQLPYMFLADSICLHGCGFLEVVYSENAPSKTVIEYVRRDHLVIPPGTVSLQAAQRIFRVYELTKSAFKDLSKRYKFNEDVVKQIESLAANTDKFIRIFKAFMRSPDGDVHVAWLADTTVSAATWLSDPKLHTFGMVDIKAPEQPPQLDPMQPQLPEPPQITPRPLLKYPLFDFPYQIEEDEKILQIQGRAALDLHAQEALTGLWTGTVNGTVRASRFYASRETAPGDEPKNQELFLLKHGYVYDGTIKQFQPNYPNQIAISVSNALKTENATSMGATDFAAVNRTDSRKTATELSLAQEEAAELSSADIGLFAIKLHAVHSFRWMVIKNYIEAAKSLNIQPQIQLPSASILPVEAILSPTLRFTMAADAQVVSRAQRRSKFQQYYGTVVNTPYQKPVLDSMLREEFPDDFPAWSQQVGQASQQQQLLGQAFGALKKLAFDNVQSIPPEAQQGLADLLNNIQTTLNPNEADPGKRG